MVELDRKWLGSFTIANSGDVGSLPPQMKSGERLAAKDLSCAVGLALRMLVIGEIRQTPAVNRPRFRSGTDPKVPRNDLAW
jgi:hypothetical protein